MNYPHPRPWLRTLLTALLLFPTSCFALVCKTQGAGETVIRGDLDSSVAIPATLADREIVWRSERTDLYIECAKDNEPGLREEIFIHLNPDNLQIGQGIRAGLSLAGVDHVQGSGRVATGHYLEACREPEDNLQACPKVRFNLGFSVFVQKFGPTPPSGVASELLDYRLFQIDGGTGANPLPGQSLSYVINNLNGLRFIACDAELQVLPETVEFGTIGIQQVVVGKPVARRPFSLVTRRDCDSPFSIGARFTPVSGTLSGDFLVPATNNAVGIRIVSARDESIIGYNTPFHLADLLGDTRANSADFNAELVWQTPYAKAGPFEAQLMVDLFYK